MTSLSSRTTRSQMNTLINQMEMYSSSGETITSWRELTKSETPKLIIMVGGPASGKSVVKVACANECDIDDAIVLNPDNLMENMHSNDLSKRNIVNRDFRTLYQDIFKNRLGINIIYDRTGAYKEHTEFIIDLIRSGAAMQGNIRYEIVLCIVVTPLDIGLERAISREKEIGRSVPPEVIRRIYGSIESIIEEYETNSDTKIFHSLRHAQKELSGKPSRKVTVDQDGTLLLPTKTKGVVPIKSGNFSIDLDPTRKTRPKEFSTPIDMTGITRRFNDVDDESKDDDHELDKDNRIYLDTDRGDRVSFMNSHMLFDKIIAFDNTIENEPPQLIYLYDQGKVVIDKEASQLARSTKERSKLLRNRFDLLDTRSARLTARGGRTRKINRKRKSLKRKSIRNKKRKSRKSHR